MEEGWLTVGEAAKELGVSVRTLQYYDREEILSPSGKSEGGRRLYSPQDTMVLYQILSLKYLGFSLEDIRTRLLSLDTPAQVCAILQAQVETVGRLDCMLNPL